MHNPITQDPRADLIRERNCVAPLYGGKSFDLSICIDLGPYPTRAVRNGQYLPLELPSGFLKLAAHEWPLSVNGERPVCALTAAGRLTECRLAEDDP